jgi:uncharacterized protein
VAIFNLTLQNENTTRVAVYDPYQSKLFWKDNNEDIVISEVDEEIRSKIFPISPQNPGTKTISLKKIKVQMGFACNYTCTYCSQNNQRSFSTDTAKKTQDKVSGFFEKMPTWFDGGEDGLGSGVHLEFWGGETLLYWNAVEDLAKLLREKYPKISLALFTNGSLVKKEMVDFAKKVSLHFIVSHDGPTFNEDRAKDPFDIPSQAEGLHYLFNTLNPLGLISFNATVSPKNYSITKIRDYIANKLGVDSKKIIVTNDLATPYDSEGLSYVTQPEKRRELVNNLFQEFKSLFPFNMKLGMTDQVMHDFYESIRISRSAEFVGQKCSMDLPSSIAVDIDGNVLTCQNVTAKGGHKIGHVDELAKVELNTAYHWSQRNECISCPVVQICKGSCMFLKDDLWNAACDQHFTWGLSYLALALFLQTDMKLIKIDGSVIRRSGITSIDVLN